MSRRARYAAASLLGVAALACPGAVVPATSAESPEAGADVVVTVRDDAIDESSGLVVRGRRMFTVNDSGDGPHLYEVDLRTGRTVGVTVFADEDPVDVEALAPGAAGTVWVGDIGDNRGVRGSVRIHRLRPARGGGEAAATSYELAYPDSPQDAEALLVHPRTGRVLVVTKNVFREGVVYRAPRRLEPGATHRLERVAAVRALVTDGTFLAGGRQVLLRTYSTGAVYSYPAFELLGEFPLPEQEQGEAVAVGGDGRVYLTSEGERFDVLALELPRFAPDEGAPTQETSPEPATPPGEQPADEAGDESGPATPGEDEAGLGRPRGYLAAAVVGSAVVALLLRASRRRSRRRR